MSANTNIKQGAIVTARQGNFGLVISEASPATGSFNEMTNNLGQTCANCYQGIDDTIVQ